MVFSNPPSPLCGHCLYTQKLFIIVLILYPDTSLNLLCFCTSRFQFHFSKFNFILDPPGFSRDMLTQLQTGGFLPAPLFFPPV